MKAAIKELSINSAPGPDGVVPSIFKDYADQLADPICKIFQNSLRHNKLHVPTAMAHIAALLKSGDVSLAANCRPVALTDHLMKLFERIISMEDF